MQSRTWTLWRQRLARRKSPILTALIIIIITIIIIIIVIIINLAPDIWGDPASFVLVAQLRVALMGGVGWLKPSWREVNLRNIMMSWAESILEPRAAVSERKVS